MLLHRPAVQVCCCFGRELERLSVSLSKDVLVPGEVPTLLIEVSIASEDAVRSMQVGHQQVVGGEECVLHHVPCLSCAL